MKHKRSPEERLVEKIKAGDEASREELIQLLDAETRDTIRLAILRLDRLDASARPATIVSAELLAHGSRAALEHVCSAIDECRDLSEFNLSRTCMGWARGVAIRIRRRARPPV